MGYYNDVFASELDLARQRLLEWGKWCQAILTLEVGISCQTLLSHLMESKGILIKGINISLTPSQQRAEEIDELINQLALEQPTIAKVLSYHYVSTEKIARRIQKLGISRGSYYLYLSEGEEWIYERL